MISAEVLLEMDTTKYPMLVEGLLPKVGLVALGGHSDTGKSSFLRDLAIHVASGEDSFLGQPMDVTKGSALYASTEDDEKSVSYLLKKQLGNVNPKLFSNLFYEFETVDLLKKLYRHLEKAPVDLIVIDAFTDVFTGDINNSVSVRNFLNKYRELANKFECCIVFLHHYGKGKDEESNSKHFFLGSQGFEAKMRVTLGLSKDPSDSSMRRLKITKGNYLSAKDKESYFKLKFHDNMRFECVGRSKTITVSKSKKDSEKKAVLLMLPKLVDEDRSWDEITKIINDRGLDYKRSTLNKWYNESLE
tara:strand:+ start:1232 stop:2140 length:909 start_codon:yes stop_codon:yes gene_type:complete